MLTCTRDVGEGGGTWAKEEVGEGGGGGRRRDVGEGGGTWEKEEGRGGRRREF